MPFYERKIISGNLVEIEQFFSHGKRIPRGARLEATLPTQAEQNEKHRKKEFVRLLNCNFNPNKDDLFVTLTFSQNVDRPAAAKAFRNFELRAKRFCKKKKTVYKRLSILEKQGQWHIHMIMSGLTLEEIQKLWGNGRVTASILNNSNHYKDLTEYLFKPEKPCKTNPSIENTKQPHQKYAKRWSGTRNLKRPVITITPIKRESIMHKLPDAPKGCVLLPDWIVSCDIYGHPLKRYAYIKPAIAPPFGKRNHTGLSVRQNK